MILETWRLLHPDCRIRLKQGKVLALLSGDSQELMSVLKATKQQIYRYKRLKSRLTIYQLNLLKEKCGVNWQEEIESIGLGASQHNICLPDKIEVDNDIAWLMGFHHTENSETPKNYGICNNQIELIEKALHGLRKLNVPEQLFRLEIRYKNDVSRDLVKQLTGKLKISDNQINLRKLPENALTQKELFTLRVNARVIRDVLYSIENKFLGNLHDRKLTGSFLQGLFDADAWYNKAKKIIIIAQRREETINLISELLAELNIEYRREYWEYRNMYVCVILFGKTGENVKKFMNLVGFSHQLKTARVNSSIASRSRS